MHIRSIHSARLDRVRSTLVEPHLVHTTPASNRSTESVTSKLGADLEVYELPRRLVCGLLVRFHQRGPKPPKHCLNLRITQRPQREFTGSVRWQT